MASKRSTPEARNPQEILRTRQRNSPTDTNRGMAADSPVNANEAIAERRKKKVMKLKENSPHAQNCEIKFEKRSTASVSGSTSKVKATASVGSSSSKVKATASVSSHTNQVKSTKKKAASTAKQPSNSSSSKRQVKALKREEPESNESQDIVWKGFRSKISDDVSVAGSLQGSWASSKDFSSSVSVAKSAASCHVRSDERIESKRRYSASALSSLARGSIRLSPFVKDTLRSKHSRSVKSFQAEDLQSCPEKKHIGKKKVRFAESSEGTKNPETASFPSSLKLTPDTIKVLWWTGEERQTMKRRAQRIGLRFLSITAKYHLAVEQLLSKCKSESSDGRSQFFAEKDAIRILINHDARGLELAMISALNLDSCRYYHRCVKQSVTCVLNAQAMWKCSNLKSDDEQWQMIATMLQQYSVVATRFARILAEGDARFVRGHYVSDVDVESSSVATGLTEESSMSTSSSSEEYDYLDGSFTI